MNLYDQRYEIRLARKSETKEVMQFIDKYWRKNHIMALDQKLFEYEFLEGNKLNIMIAKDKETQHIEAILGFLKASHVSDSNKLDIWGSIWKVNNEGHNMGFLGIELWKRLKEYLNCRSYLGIGINPQTSAPLHKLVFKQKIAKMNHYYYLNPDVEEYKVAKIVERKYGEIANVAHKIQTVEFHNIEQIKETFRIEKLDSIPYKDYWYIEKRYFKHPYYQYHVYGLLSEIGEVGALLITRIIEQNKRKIIRIVDYIGNHELFKNMGRSFLKMMKEYDCEYMDFYEFGFEEEYIIPTGFIRKGKEDLNTIPNYFEPFVEENVDIWIRYADDTSVFFKADGDQDRPNILQSN